MVTIPATIRQLIQRIVASLLSFRSRSLLPADANTVSRLTAWTGPGRDGTGLLFVAGLVTFLAIYAACGKGTPLPTPTVAPTPALTAIPSLAIATEPEVQTAAASPTSAPSPEGAFRTPTVPAEAPIAESTVVASPTPTPAPTVVFGRPVATAMPTRDLGGTTPRPTPAAPGFVTIGEWTLETFTGFDRPQALLFDGDHIWVADVGDDSVIKMSQDGTIVSRTTVGLFPRALAFDGKEIWVANAGHDTITRLNREGEVLDTFFPGGGTGGPASLVFDGERMWLAAAWGNRVARLDSDGSATFSVRIPGEHPAPSAMAFDGEALWVASLNLPEVQKLSDGGERLERFKVGSRSPEYLGVGTFSGGQGPSSIAFDGENIWVAINWLNQVIKLSRDGEILGEFDVGRWPISITSDGESVWVANWWDDNVMRLALDGTILATLPMGSRPIAVISAGEAIWVANEDGESVTKIIHATGTAQTPRAGGDGGTLRVALASFGGESLDPSLDGQGGLPYHGHMFDHLLGATPAGRLSTRLGALESWDASPDGKSFTLVLKKGMRWHDNEEVTSADIDFSMAYYGRDGATCGGCPGLKASLERVEIVDRYTARLHLKSPDVAFMQRLGPIVGDMPLLPQAREGSPDGDRLGQSPVGSGLWVYAERTLGESIEFKANLDYWDGERSPGFDRLQLIQVPDPELRVALLRSGAVDISALRHTDVEPLKEMGFDIQGPKYVTATTMRFFMSYDSAFLTSRLKFRKALVLGMNLDSIVQSVYPPEAASVPTGSTLFSPVSDGYDPELPPYPYDPERATALLQEAGYRGETVDLFSIVAYGLAEMPLINELIAEQWRQIGLNVRIITTDFLQVRARYAARPQAFDDVSPAPLFHGAFPTQPDVVSTIRRYMTSAADGVMAYHDLDEGDRIYEELAALADPAERDRHLRELNRELYEQYWAADIVWRHDVFGLSPAIEGWQPTDGTSSDLHLETVRPVR